MKLSQSSLPSEASQFIYAVLVIILIPAAIAVNTLYLVHSMQRDTDFELNNKALLVESVIAMGVGNNINDSKLQGNIQKLIITLPEIKAIEILKLNQQDELSSLATTSQVTKAVNDPVLNQLAWGTNQAYSKQITAALGLGSSERVWLVAAPIHDPDGKKVGLLDLYLSANQIDQITSRTFHDSLIILTITMVGIILLLLNHFRLFEISLLFKKLRDTDTLKDDFISIASHELRSPIFILKGYTALLSKDAEVLTNEQIKKEIEQIAENAKRLQVLVEDLLNVSRIEQSRITLTIIPLDIRDILTPLVQDFYLQAQEKGLQLTYAKNDSPLIIYGDKDKLHEIFSNLISNAIKYTPSGSVAISHAIQSNNVKTYIKDTGVGISEENKYKLFQKFSRIYNEKTKEVSGTGLGLWITKQLVEKMKGKIYIESIEKQGAQVIISFPQKTR